jgi:hypothetical protein
MTYHSCPIFEISVWHTIAVPFLKFQYDIP